MAPQTIQTDTGRIIRCCNYPSIGASSESAQDKLTGKVFMAGSVGESVFGVQVSIAVPDEPAYYSFLAVSGESAYPPAPQSNSRIYFIVPPNKQLQIYCYNCGGGNEFYTGKVGVFEVNPPVGFDILTMTWNTQPPTDALLTYYTHTLHKQNVWVTIPTTGTTGVICLQLVSEYQSDFYAWYRSTIYSDANFRPRII